MKKFVLGIVTSLFMLTTVNAAPDTQGKRPDFNNLCHGKAVNTKVKTKLGDRTVEGSCQIGFKATNANALERGDNRLPAVQNACRNKAKGSAVTVKVNNKNIAGKCDSIFKSNMKR